MASFVTKPVSTNIQSINPFTCNQSQNQTRQILQAIPMHVVSRINQPFVVPSQTNRNSFICKSLIYKSHENSPHTVVTLHRSSSFNMQPKTSTNITATMRGQTSTDNTQLSATIFPA
ncbi:unnamed protein product, partial [Rotaria magnacalcarata]